jgi:histone arginine demethylase JMJD6
MIEERAQISPAAFDALASVDRISGMPHREYLRQYVQCLRPVILTDAMLGWRALEVWTPEFFRRQYGAVAVRVEGREFSMADLVDRVLASTREDPAPYLNRTRIDCLLPELLDDIRPRSRYMYPNWLESKFFPARSTPGDVELLFGGAGARFPVLHWDGLHTHAFICQIYGSKQVVLYHPGQTPLLYPATGRERNRSMIDDLDHPDLQRFPLFAQARPLTTVLGPGDSLFVPMGWWHTTHLPGPSIGVTWNTVNGVNWPAFVRDYSDERTRKIGRLAGSALRAYLTTLGLIVTAHDAVRGRSARGSGRARA